MNEQAEQKQKKRIDPTKIHIRRIKVFKSDIDTTPEYLDDPKKFDEYEFRVGKEVAFNTDAGAARYRLFLKIDAQDADEKSLGLTAEFGIEYHFEIENFDENIRTDNGEAQINFQLATVLLAIAYSTSRGIILERMLGTYFEGLVIPVVDPGKVMRGEEV